MKAARAPRRPERILPRFVDSERESMWPEIRDKGRQTKNLRRRLQAAASNASSEHIGRWFYEMAHPVHLEAYDSGVPVSISGIATAESGFQVDWYIGIDALERPSINLTASAYKLRRDDPTRHQLDPVRPRRRHRQRTGLGTGACHVGRSRRAAHARAGGAADLGGHW